MSLLLSCAKNKNNMNPSKSICNEKPAAISNKIKESSNTPSVQSGYSYEIVSIPMPAFEKVDVYIENSSFLGWTPSGKYFCYLIERSGLGMLGRITVELMLQNSDDNKRQSLKVFEWDYKTDESLRFSNLSDLFKKNKSEITAILSKHEIAAAVNNFNPSAVIAMDNKKITIDIEKKIIGLNGQINYQINAVHKNYKKTIYEYMPTHDLYGVTDLEYKGYFTNYDNTVAVVVTNIETENIEGTTVYTVNYKAFNLK